MVWVTVTMFPSLSATEKEAGGISLVLTGVSFLPHLALIGDLVSDALRVVPCLSDPRSVHSQRNRYPPCTLRGLRTRLESLREHMHILGGVDLHGTDIKVLKDI